MESYRKGVFNPLLRYRNLVPLGAWLMMGKIFILSIIMYWKIRFLSIYLLIVTILISDWNIFGYLTLFLMEYKDKPEISNFLSADDLEENKKSIFII